jgi:hypothetical protein
MEDRPPPDQREIDFIRMAEELLEKIQEIAREIQERVWRLARGHGLSGPHDPRTAEELKAAGEGAGQRQEESWEGDAPPESGKGPATLSPHEGVPLTETE